MTISKNIKQREVYINRVKPFIRKSLIKVFTGQRRVGKSYLLFQIMELIKNDNSNANIIYINKEDIEFDFIKSSLNLYDFIKSKLILNEYNYIFIDEIQEIAEFEKTLRSLLLDDKNDIYITGSNAKMLSGELATYLSGRYIEFNVLSLSYPEFLHFHNLKDSNSSYKLFIKYGGLPYLINLELTDNVVNEYLKSIYNTIILRDVVSRYHIRDTDFLEKLIFFISNNIGSLFSAKNISDYLKSQKSTVSVNQIQTYISYLVNAFLIHKVQRYDLIGKKVFQIGDKYYFENLGLRNAISGYKISDKDIILENIVYNHLIFKGYKVNVGTLKSEEIDFVCEKDGEKLYIQVTLRIENEKTIEREFGNLLKIQNNYMKMVITEDEFQGNTYEGIIHKNVRDFLLS